MNDSRNPHVGIEALLTPQNSVLLLIDHQPFQFANLHSHEPTLIVNNVVGLAKTAKVFQVPTILTTVLEERGGLLIKDVQDVFPDQKPINRSFINTWEDKRVVEAVKKTGRKKLVIASLWTEMCLAMPAIQAQGEGYDVYAVTDASGGVSVEAHDMAIRRMVQAGVTRLSPGLPCLASGSAIGRALKRWVRSPKFSFSTAAPLASLLPGRCSFSVALQKRREQTSARSRYRTITRRHHS